MSTSYATYFGQMSPGQLSGQLAATGAVWVRYPWTDTNGDQFVQRNELDFARGFRSTPSANYDPANPASVVTPNRVDPNLENDITDEFVTTLDHELRSGFAVGISYIWRNYHNFQESYRNATPESYSPVTFTAACGNALCDARSYTATYYQRATPLPAGTLLRNDNASRSYNGIELGWWCRKSLMKYLDPDELFDITTNDDGGSQYLIWLSSLEVKPPTAAAGRNKAASGASGLCA